MKMTYIIIEMQTNNGVTAVVPPVSYANENQAEAAYHTALAAAAVSSVQEHAVSMLKDSGELVKKECYYHFNEAAV